MQIDAQDLIDGIEDSDVLKELSGKAARKWFSTSQELLTERGDEHEYEVFPVMRSATAPVWKDEDGGWVFTYPHVAAKYFEFGTDPHVIKPKHADYLKFPWPDAPEKIQQRFRAQWDDPQHWLEEPEVLMPEVHHPGTPALRFIRDARRRLMRDHGNA